MRNPLKTEADAFRFLLLAIGYFAVIVGAAAIDRWAGVAAFLAETAAIVWWFFGRGRGRSKEQPVARLAAPPHGAADRRVLVVANETVGGAELLTAIRRIAAGGRTRVHVVSPALNAPLRHWVSDEDGARRDAADRLEASLEAIRGVGVEATGEVGDGDPLQAIADCQLTFAPDELVIATHPAGRSNWLERDVVTHARERFEIPVTHVVVDLGDRRAPPTT